MSISTNEYDRIRNSVTVKAFMIIDNGSMLARVRIVRPCRLRTGMEKYTAHVECMIDGFKEAIGKAGGCGYDKGAFALAAALQALGASQDAVQDARMGKYALAVCRAIGATATAQAYSM